MSDTGLELASRDDMCWLCSGLKEYRREVDLEGPPHTCRACKGTGRVPRFPVVRIHQAEHKLCGPGKGWRGCIHDREDSQLHYMCQGRGWTVSDNPIAWVEALLSIGFQPRFEYTLNDKTVVLFQDYYVAWGDATGETWLEALQQALLKVTA